MKGKQAALYEDFCSKGVKGLEKILSWLLTN